MGDGPFVLSHLDLRWPNIIVDDDLDILAVIDWEWTGSIPRQLFTPPSWIAGQEPPFVTGDEYRAEFAHFREILLIKADTSDACHLLSEEWDFELLSSTSHCRAATSPFSADCHLLPNSVSETLRGA